MNKKDYHDYLFIILGAAIAGFGIACFVTPARIAPGGVNGIATILYYTIGIDTGLAMLLVSVPLFLLAIKIFGPQYGARCLTGMLLLALFVSIFGQLTGYHGFLDYGDKIDIMLSAIFGGITVGAGIGLVMKSGANTGGTDILAQALSKYSFIPVGTSLFFFDGLVVISGGIFFGVESALFALIDMYIQSQVINYVLMNMGNHYAKTAYIVSDNYEAISKRIISDLHHGGTLIDGKGIFTLKKRTMLMAVVPNRMITALTHIVHEEDENAFMFVLETYQVLGFGFVPISKVLARNKNASDAAIISKKNQIPPLKKPQTKGK